MRIQHNITAMNAYRNYNNNTSALSKNLEKLSSGYKINRAGDDAAGLAISEKMRAQITGLNAAQKNVKDGISLVKTAEGAMQEIQDMLNRMDYLATQSANGTYDNEVDRANLQKEVEALKSEINRIADSANFNGIKLLDGSMEKTSSRSVQVSGADRILSSVIGEGEKAWQVVGNKTVLDTPSAAAQTGSFKVDLSTLTFTGVGSGQASVDFTLTVGDKTWTATASGINATSNSLDTTAVTAIASSIVSEIGSTAVINGVEWSVTNGGGGTIIFTQKAKPSTAAEAQCNFDVKVNMVNTTANATTTLRMDSSHLEGTQVLQQGIAAEGANRANTIFRIDASDIRDGARITIGDKTLTLRVGANSQIASSAANTVDLTDMEEGKIDLNKALGKISAVFGQTPITDSKATNGKGDKVNPTLKVGVSDGSNGQPVGLVVQRSDTITAASQAAYTTKDKLAAVFSMSYTTSAQSGLTLQIGDTSDNFNQMTVSIGDMHTGAMKIDGIDIGNQEGAREAIQTIKDAINYVSGIRGDLGAVQNRLEHTQNNLSVMAENIQDAESTIRDTDVAEEMMGYVKNNILVQSAQAMLAQANQLPQGVLQLLG